MEDMAMLMSGQSAMTGWREAVYWGMLPFFLPAGINRDKYQGSRQRPVNHFLYSCNG